MGDPQDNGAALYAYFVELSGHDAMATYLLDVQ